MVAVGITIDLSRYKGTAHYITCGLWSAYHTHSNRQVPASIKIKMCPTCKPKPEDVVKIAKKINWAKNWKKEKVHRYGDAMNKRVGKSSFDEVAERMHVQRQLTGGRTLRAKHVDYKDWE